MTSRRVKYKNFVDELQKAKNRVKARVRAKVEHAFRILKRIFGFEKVRYRGIKKNHERLCACFALVNLYLHRKRLAIAQAQCVWNQRALRIPERRQEKSPENLQLCSARNPSPVSFDAKSTGCSKVP
jgi:hypothetical protein